MKPALGLLVCLSIGISVTPALAADPVGKVDRVHGESTGMVGDSTQPLAPDTPVFLNEAVSTGPDGRLALTFQDGTMLTLGEKAKVSIDEFVYQPAGANRLRMSVSGAFRYISGKLDPGGVRDAMVTTPYAVIGVRGTDFWGGPVDGQTGFVLFEGAIDVSVGGTTVVIDNPGTGVAFDAGAAQPGMVYVWAEDKVQRAIATVTFR